MAFMARQSSPYSRVFRDPLATITNPFAADNTLVCGRRLEHDKHITTNMETFIQDENNVNAIARHIATYHFANLIKKSNK